MPETRHRTILEIGVDDRGLRQLAPSMERALNPKLAEAFEKSLERSTRSLAKMAEHQTKLGRLLADQARQAATRAREEERIVHAATYSDAEARRVLREIRDSPIGAFGRGATGAFRGSTLGTFGHALGGAARTVAGGGSLGSAGLGLLAGTAGIAVGALGSAILGGASHIMRNLPFQEGFLSQMLGVIPILGPVVSGAISGATSFYQSFAAQQIARARAFGATGIGNYGDLVRIGLNLGLGPTELPAMLAQLAQAGGVRGDLLRNVAPDALAFQVLGGIDAGASGALLRSVLAGTRTDDVAAEEQATSIVAEGVAAGLAAGLREARIGEALQQIGATVTQLRTEGIMVDVSETLALMRGLGRLGGAFAGEAGVQTAQSITGAFARAADREGILSALAIRHRMETYGEDYLTAARQLETDPVGAFRAVMQTLRRHGGYGLEHTLYTELRAMGVPISRTQAWQLANLTEEDIAGMTGPTPEGEALIDAFLGRQRREAAGPLIIARLEAAHEARRARLGGDFRRGGMGRTALQARELEIAMIQRYAPRLQEFAQATLREVEGLFQAFERGGLSGVLRHVMGRAVEGALPGINEALELAGMPGLTPEQGQQIADVLTDQISILARAAPWLAAGLISPAGAAVLPFTEEGRALIGGTAENIRRFVDVFSPSGAPSGQTGAEQRVTVSTREGENIVLRITTNVTQDPSNPSPSDVSVGR